MPNRPTPRRVRVTRLLVTLPAVVLIALTVAQLPVRGQRDLDALDEPRLAALLTAELDDIFDKFQRDGSYADDDLVEALMGALSDQGDDDSEDDISLADLEAEIDEFMDDEGVEELVEMSVLEADQEASGPRPQRFRTVLAAARQGPTPGFARPSLAVSRTTANLTRAVRMVRR